MCLSKKTVSLHLFQIWHLTVVLLCWQICCRPTDSSTIDVFRWPAAGSLHLPDCPAGSTSQLTSSSSTALWLQATLSAPPPTGPENWLILVVLQKQQNAALPKKCICQLHIELTWTDLEASWPAQMVIVTLLFPKAGEGAYMQERSKAFERLSAALHLATDKIDSPKEKSLTSLFIK